jgi:hypothetical protein
MDYRAACGENITKDSLVMRDTWQTTNIPHSASGGSGDSGSNGGSGGTGSGLATCPKKISYSGLLKIVDRALWTQGLRQPLVGKKRHLYKITHGFRKYFKTQAELAGMKTLFVERLMGHDTGLAESYFIPDELLDDYLKAVPNLTIESLPDQVVVEQTQRQTQELTERMQTLTKENEISKQTISRLKTNIFSLLDTSENDQQEIAALKQKLSEMNTLTKEVDSMREQIAVLERNSGEFKKLSNMTNLLREAIDIAKVVDPRLADLLAGPPKSREKSENENESYLKQDLHKQAAKRKDLK